LRRGYGFVRYGVSRVGGHSAVEVPRSRKVIHGPHTGLNDGIKGLRRSDDIQEQECTFSLSKPDRYDGLRLYEI